ncbi:MAG TPA: helix-turn-helix domain-containing protein [Blastocatellia bacterium]|nr:helix-turn-helix domain-containing protein [Blastocatellia bacterium]
MAITTAEAAEMLGTSERRVRQLAEELGVEKFGKQYLITDKDLKRMQARKTQRGPEKKVSKK